MSKLIDAHNSQRVEIETDMDGYIHKLHRERILTWEAVNSEITGIEVGAPKIYIRNSLNSFFANLDAVPDPVSLCIITYQLGQSLPSKILNLISNAKNLKHIRVCFNFSEKEIKKLPNAKVPWNEINSLCAINQLINTLKASDSKPEVDFHLLTSSHIKYLSVNEAWVAGSMNVSSTAEKLVTQADKFRKKEDARNYSQAELLLSFEKGGTEIGEKILEVLKKNKHIIDTYSFSLPSFLGVEDFRKFISRNSKMLESPYFTEQLTQNDLEEIPQKPSNYVQDENLFNHLQDLEFDDLRNILNLELDEIKGYLVHEWVALEDSHIWTLPESVLKDVVEQTLEELDYHDNFPELGSSSDAGEHEHIMSTEEWDAFADESFERDQEEIDCLKRKAADNVMKYFNDTLEEAMRVFLDSSDKDAPI